jgi:hypothetical protein
LIIWAKAKVEAKAATIQARRANLQEKVVVTLLRSDPWKLSIFSKP